MTHGRGQILALVLASTLFAGCAIFLRQEPSPQEPAAPGWGSEPQAPGSPKAWGPMSVMEFADRTDQDAGRTVARAFCTILRYSRKDSPPEPLPWPGARFKVEWLQSQAQKSGIRFYVGGTISGIRFQENRHCLWLSLTVRLIDASDGKIIVTKRLVTQEPMREGTSLRDLLERAALSAAREFFDEFSP